MAKIKKILIYIGCAILLWFVLSVILGVISISKGITDLPIWNLLGLTLKLMA